MSANTMTTKKHDGPDALLASLSTDGMAPEDLMGKSGLLNQRTKRLLEKVLKTELAEHLGHDRHKALANTRGNTSNGQSKKTPTFFLCHPAASHASHC